MGRVVVLLVDGMLGFVILGLWIFCFLDVITTQQNSCRNLSKTAWLILVVLLPAIGSVAWLVAGRPIADESAGMPGEGNGVRGRYAHPSTFSDRERPRRPISSSPDDDEAFLRGVRERAAEQRRVYRAQKRRELGETDPPLGS